MTSDDIATWDAEAAAFDEPVDHGLRDPDVREAWRDLLLGVLPRPPARIADLGSGTGTLSVLLADAGYVVDGVDFSGEMVARANAKAQGRRDVSFVQADAFDPPLPAASYDVALSRHVLWAMPDPALALEHWIRLLAPGGSLVLVEGYWSNSAGLRAEETVALVEATGREARLTRLTDASYWGREIDDDRYLVVSPAQAANSRPIPRSD